MRQQLFLLGYCIHFSTHRSLLQAPLTTPARHSDYTYPSLHLFPPPQPLLLLHLPLPPHSPLPPLTLAGTVILVVFVPGRAGSRSVLSRLARKASLRVDAKLLRVVTVVLFCRALVDVCVTQVAHLNETATRSLVNTDGLSRKAKLRRHGHRFRRMDITITFRGLLKHYIQQ